MEPPKSPLLFTLYTNDCVSSDPNQHVVKFSDHAVIISLMAEELNGSTHRAAVVGSVSWNNNHKLHINTSMTVETLLNTRSAGDQTSVTLLNKQVMSELIQ